VTTKSHAIKLTATTGTLHSANLAGRSVHPLCTEMLRLTVRGSTKPRQQLCLAGFGYDAIFFADALNSLKALIIYFPLFSTTTTCLLMMMMLLLLLLLLSCRIKVRK
jgi:hypothetical protein